MRRLLPSLVLSAAALAFASFADSASAAPRAGHGFRGGGKPAFAVHRGVRHAGLHRFGHGRFAHHRFGHGFRRGAFGGAWVYGDGYGYPYGAPVNVAVEQNVMTGGYGPPSVLDLPASTGIRTESAAQPVIYVIRSGPRPLMRKGSRGGAKVASLPGGRAAEPAATGSLGPRIVEVTAPRGF
ncbi:MAG TPA: hypothetical protein VF744_21500 [Beijerinckiaceae bacterium]|jgi:hypothetical protein